MKAYSIIYSKKYIDQGKIIASTDGVVMLFAEDKADAIKLCRGGKIVPDCIEDKQLKVFELVEDQK